MFKSVNANKLTVGQMVLARIWLGNGKYEFRQTRVLAVQTGKLNHSRGGFKFEGLETVESWGSVKVMHNGKVRRATFLQAEALRFPALAAPESTAEVVEAVEPVAASKPARKPLTAEQKARKNELARARRAAARAAA